MGNILDLLLLGVIAGVVACFWTRIIEPDMIFGRIGVWLHNKEYTARYTSGHLSIWVRFIQCSFCLQPWIMFLLALFYIITFHPYWVFAVVGVFGGLGTGNLIVEVVHSLRNNE